MTRHQFVAAHTTTGTACVGKKLVAEQNGMTCWAHCNEPASTLLCTSRTHRLEQHLAELPARLHLVAAIHDGQQTPRRTDRPGGDTPAPANIDALDLLNAALDVLRSWAQLVCDERHLTGPRDGTLLTAWLLGHLDWLTRQPWIDDMTDEINDLATEAERLCRINPHRHRLEPPCPSCGAGELGRWDGTEQVDCASCGRVWPEDQYPWMVRLALDDSGGCLTATQAATRLGVTVGSLRSLVHEGAVRKLGTVEGTARYSARDIEELERRAS